MLMDKKIMIVFGTRPEAIKMCPIINELRSRNYKNFFVCATGQHLEMLDQVLEVFGVVPKYNLQIMTENQTLFTITTSILQKIEKILIDEKPDLVLVHGDTSTTFVTSLACYYMQIPVGHVEAGLRTNDIYSPYPEEFNREAVSLIAKYNFAPTKLARENLIKEGKDPHSIYITGNTAIDALQTTIKSDFVNEELEWAKGSRMILVTAHRRENIGQPMENIFSAIKELVELYPDIKVIYPIHKNPIVREIAKKHFSGLDRVHLIEPLNVVEFHNFISKSYFVMTDSGGIQEEAPSLGKPVLVLRDVTERPEGIEAGTLKLVGTDKETIIKEASLLLDNSDEYLKMSLKSNPYGDGKASKRIVDILLIGETNE